MMLIIGLLLIIPVRLLINKINSIKTTKKEKYIINIILFLISISFIILCMVINEEPFQFDISNSLDYIIFAAVIYIFSPFLWIVTIHYMSYLIKKVRVNKNAKIKDDKDFIYYRDDLDKISPNIIMFTSQYDIDYQKSISATILKLRLNGYIKENRKKLKYTGKDKSDLSDSEKMVLNFITNNNFNKKEYLKAIEDETIKNKYVKKNSGGLFSRVVKIIFIIITCVMFFKGSIYLDQYTFDNYYLMTDIRDNQKYFELNLDKDIEKLSKEVKNKKDYYSDDNIYYDYSCIRADKLQYSVVRKAMFLNIFVPISILFCIVWLIITIYMVIDQLLHINKNYRRTIKGKKLLSKAYALKNFLNDFSIIEKRTKEEIVLWEYYLVYAVALGVNVKIQDEIIEQYF